MSAVLSVTFTIHTNASPRIREYSKKTAAKAHSQCFWSLEGRRSFEDEVLKGCYRSWEIWVIVRRGGRIPWRVEDLRDWWFGDKDPKFMELSGVLWTYCMWSSQAELSLQFMATGCSLRELHSPEALILSCVAGERGMVLILLIPAGPEKSRPRGLSTLGYRRQDSAGCQSSVTFLTWCPPPAPAGQAAYTKNSKKKNRVPKDPRGQVKCDAFVPDLNWNLESQRVELFPDRHKSTEG